MPALVVADHGLFVGRNGVRVCGPTSRLLIVLDPGIKQGSAEDPRRLADLLERLKLLLHGLALGQLGDALFARLRLRQLLLLHPQLQACGETPREAAEQLPEVRHPDAPTPSGTAT